MNPKLVLSFPDGVRGGRGRIQGVGPWPPRPRLEDKGIVPAYLETLLEIVRDCGAVDPVYRHYSHRYCIISQSTNRDFDVVEALRQKVRMHFNAGIASVDDRGFPGQIDSTVFLDLEKAGGHPPPWEPDESMVRFRLIRERWRREQEKGG